MRRSHDLSFGTRLALWGPCFKWPFSSIPVKNWNVPLSVVKRTKSFQLVLNADIARLRNLILLPNLCYHSTWCACQSFFVARLWAIYFVRKREETRQQERAATKIQAQYRGYRTRKSVSQPAKKDDAVGERIEDRENVKYYNEYSNTWKISAMIICRNARFIAI